jgi:hypothetical protein
MGWYGDDRVEQPGRVRHFTDIALKRRVQICLHDPGDVVPVGQRRPRMLGLEIVIEADDKISAPMVGERRQMLRQLRTPQRRL